MVNKLPYRLTLASGSPARRYLLEKAGYTFDIRAAHIKEPTEASHGSCRQYVQEVAWLKAAAVAPSVDEGLVLSADTVGWLDGRVIGKPCDEEDARRILRALSGHVHELWTGICFWLVKNDWQIQYQERTLVRMRPLSDAELEDYIRTKKWVGCSGAYAIQEENDPFLTIEEGSLTNVIGLPMESLSKALQIFQ